HELCLVVLDVQLAAFAVAAVTHHHEPECFELPRIAADAAVKSGVVAPGHGVTSFPVDSTARWRVLACQGRHGLIYDGPDGNEFRQPRAYSPPGSPLARPVWTRATLAL